MINTLSRVILSIIILSSCHQLKNEKVLIPEYPVVEGIAKRQSKLLHGRSLAKKVSLDQKTEKNTLELDSLKWLKELNFINDLNPNLPEYVGVFDVLEDDQDTRLQLKKGEKSKLVQLIVRYSGGRLDEIFGTIHEDKDVYVYHRDINIQFSNGLVSTYKIAGFQKMLWNDTVKFEIDGTVIQ